jgi:hypothetical protein
MDHWQISSWPVQCGFRGNDAATELALRRTEGGLHYVALEHTASEVALVLMFTRDGARSLRAALNQALAEWAKADPELAEVGTEPPHPDGHV